MEPAAFGGLRPFTYFVEWFLQPASGSLAANRVAESFRMFPFLGAMVCLSPHFLFVVGIVYRLCIHHGEYQFSGKGGQCGHNQHEEEWTSVRGFLSMSCPEFPELFCYVLFTRRPDVLCVPYDRPIDALSSYSASSLPQPPSTCRLDGL